MISFYSIEIHFRQLFLTVITALILFPSGRGFAQVDCAIDPADMHRTVYCMDGADLSNIPGPAFEGPCGEVAVSLESQSYYRLGCGQMGLSGYFAPQRWETKILGDGGVDVTGAPNKLVEGANEASLVADAREKVLVSILIPADGYVTFSWKHFGGSNLFQVLTNGQVQNPGSSHYRSGLLPAGSTLSLILDNRKGKEPQQIKITNFNLLTNAVGVAVRHWRLPAAPPSQKALQQLITVERTNISNVFFPEDLDGIHKRELDSSMPRDPSMTGYPFIDRDGDPATLHDQFDLKKGNCQYDVAWKDVWQNLGDTYLLVRQWEITDHCGDNVLTAKQLIKFTDPPRHDQIPRDAIIIQDALPGNQGQLPSSRMESELPANVISGNFAF